MLKSIVSFPPPFFYEIQLPKFLQGATAVPDSTTKPTPTPSTTTAQDNNKINDNNNDNDINSVEGLAENGKLVRRGFCGLEKKRCGGSGPATGETYFYQTCSKDADCADGLAKCCFDGCGYECQKPVFLKEEEVEAVVDASDGGVKQPEVKKGVCPPPGISNAVVTLCRHDADCYGAYKCCNTMGGGSVVTMMLVYGFY